MITSRLSLSIIIIFLFILSCPFAAASISVGNVVITPAGDLVSGTTEVTASLIVDFAGESGLTFPSESTLHFYSDLENAQWSPVLLQNGIENTRPLSLGNNFNVNGWELSYPTTKNEISFRMTLTGTTPRVDASKNITVIKVEELNTKNVAVKESAVIKERYVSNPAEVKGLVQAEKGKLDAFRISIDSAASKGVNTDTAEVQYTAAKVALESAAKATSVQSSQQYATAAERAIADGEKSIGDSLTQKMITEAGEPIDLLDEQIVFFRVNRSMTADARVADIQARRDRAAGLISTANDLRKEGKFTDAQAKIGEARNVADQAYEAALALRKEVGESSNPTELITKPLESSVSFLKGALIWIGVGLILVVLVVVGVILMRRRSGWDELG
ncbi:MAG: hypothetical protein NT074_06455 [Methanomicrobiales archaeon]|nr:hypothetical protein [Methanomicrobiales archaeon]